MLIFLACSFKNLFLFCPPLPYSFLPYFPISRSSYITHVNKYYCCCNSSRLMQPYTNMCKYNTVWGHSYFKKEGYRLAFRSPPPNISRNSSKSTRKAQTDFCLFLSAKSSVTSMYRNVLLFSVGNYSSFSFFLHFVLNNSNALCRPFQTYLHTSAFISLGQKSRNQIQCLILTAIIKLLSKITILIHTFFQQCEDYYFPHILVSNRQNYYFFNFTSR